MRQVATDTFVLGTRGHNFYLLREEDEVTLIDAGCSREWRKLVAGLESIGLVPDAIRGIAATHSHADHFGLAKRATSEGLPVTVHEDEESRALGTYTGRFAVTPTELPMLNPFALRTFLPMILAGIMSLDHVDRVATFSDGDRLDLPGQPVAVHTPGHTEGHSMFHCPDRGLLFTGDGLATMDLLGPGTGPQVMERRFHLDPEQALASLTRIEDLDADLLLPGHGAPWKGSPSEAVTEIRRG